MRLRAITVFLLLALLAAGCSSEIVYRGIRIQGPPGFQENIARALLLIEMRSPEQYADISFLAKRIRLTSKRPAPDVAAYCDGQDVCFVRDYFNRCIQLTRVYPMAFYSVPAVIVHETTHLRQSHDGRETLTVDAEAGALRAEQLMRVRLVQAYEPED